jgi:hypothetical protein
MRQGTSPTTRRDSSPFITSIAQREALRAQARLLRVQWLMLAAQTIIIALLVADRFL